MKLAFSPFLTTIIFLVPISSCDKVDSAATSTKEMVVDAASTTRDKVGSAATATKDAVFDAASATRDKLGDAASVSGTWWKQNRATRTQLKNNEYALFQSENVLLERLTKDLRTLQFQDIAVGEHLPLKTARVLASTGNLDASIEQYSRWQDEWLQGPVAPPLDQIKEALLAPSMAFTLHYVRARSMINPMNDEEQDEVIRLMLPGPFHSPVKTGLKSCLALPQIETARNVLASAQLHPEEAPLLGDPNHVSVLDTVAIANAAGPAGIAPSVMGFAFWEFASGHEDRTAQEAIYGHFINSIFESYEQQQNELIDNKALFLLIKDLLEYKERADAHLEAALVSPLLSPKQVAELRSFREAYREYYDQHIRLVCLYYVDMPLRMRLLWTSLSLDRAKGWDDDESAIQEAGLSLAGVVAQLEFFVDGSTHKLFGDIWQRFKEELDDEEFETLKTKSRFVPDWMKTLGVKDIEAKVSSK